MAITAAPWTWYDSALKNISLPGLLTDDIRVALLASAYTFNAATHEFYDVSITDELATANGYIAGGLVLTTKALAAGANPGEWKFTTDNPIWTAAVGNIVAKSAIMYNNTPATNKPLLGFCFLDYNAGAPLDVTTAPPFTLTITVPAAGWFYTQKVNG